MGFGNGCFRGCFSPDKSGFVPLRFTRSQPYIKYGWKVKYKAMFVRAIAKGGHFRKQ